MKCPVPFRTALLKTESSDGSSGPEVPLLPATYRRNYKIEPVSNNIGAFLDIELNVRRLNEVHKWLWLVGLPSAPRPLHYQVVKKREIVVTEQLDLHLVWSSASSSSILLKPLPRFLLCPNFWVTEICPRRHLYETALGFMLSYVALIEREVDYNLAINHGLIPKEVTWSGWLALVGEVVCTSVQTHTIDASAASSVSLLEDRPRVNQRFNYGELRLGRLNWIYRLAMGELRGYLSGCSTYGAFMRDNVNSLITLFAYTTIVLSAMQVGLATEPLANDYSFGMASYVFSLFSILAPLACIVAILGVIAFMFVVNLARTLRIRGQKRRQGVKV
ncbi:hypothetical protein J4E85_003849 [Alternaria conjuncta]|uniref:uncharacterized protein n=1 Tax=Alternaria conjuncta TaxID=181017 RepID=UPI00221EC005|nr:uncharacterized protein J4E85_003849 [Alternaria conjuncta]KAI4931259.1 hypothetical protein J4E85_003849 [Alternaria conjuncta]